MKLSPLNLEQISKMFSRDVMFFFHAWEDGSVTYWAKTNGFVYLVTWFPVPFVKLAAKITIEEILLSIDTNRHYDVAMDF